MKPLNFAYKKFSLYMIEVFLRAVYTYPSGCTGDSKVPETAKLFRALPEANAKGVLKV